MGRHIIKYHIASGSDLPIGYTKLEYLQSSGTQYINTGWTFNENKLPIIINCDFIYLAWVAEAIYGFADAGITNAFIPFRNAGTGNATEVYYSDWGGTGHGVLYGKTLSEYITSCKLYTWTAQPDYTSLNVTYNGRTPLPLNGHTANISTTAPLLLFAASSGDNILNPATIKMKSFSIQENGVYVHNMIPAKRNSDSEAGMYDLVTNTFYTNAGTGLFIAGPEIQTVYTNGFIATKDGDKKISHIVKTAEVNN